MDFFDVLGITSVVDSLKDKLHICEKPHLEKLRLLRISLDLSIWMNT